MKKQFNINRQNRRLLRSILSKVPIELLSQIPEGFRNNLWWNIAHVVATQQILLYRWSGVPTRISPDWIDTYKKGTIPLAKPDQEQVDRLMEDLMNTVVWAEEDYQNKIFEEYEEYTTSVKVTLSSVEDAIQFNNYHEGIHLGVVLSQLKALGISLS